MKRTAEIRRETRETQITARLNLDGSGLADVSTGIGFFDHMLILFAKHGLFDLELSATGDLHVDAHHTVEDSGIVLGKAVSAALGDKSGIKRYGFSYVPMDEALARVIVDASGRAFLDCAIPGVSSLPPVGSFSVQLAEEFLRAFAFNAGLTVHAHVLAGRDSHHICEAIFKGLARALDQATLIDSRVKDIPSTKGVL